ncbi:MAG: hypothetical protein QNK37_22655 [Acidobacteriota bacterium]|nr:hypothetical protein [Acidobacteriota bacterium]
MFRRFLPLFLLLFLSTPLLADIESQTSINDVYNRGSSEFVGSITMTTTADDFPGVSPEAPAYIRITLADGATLAKTLVDSQSSIAPYNQPIFLAMELITMEPGLTIAAPLDTASIVRWVSGEDSIWICISRPTNTWLQREGVGAEAPSADHKVAFTIGVSARSSYWDNRDPDISNRPFNSRSTDGTDDPVLAVSALLCLDLSQSTLTIDGADSLLEFSAAAFGSAAATGNGEFAPNDPLAVTFANDFNIARGKTRECTVSIPFNITSPKIESTLDESGFVQITREYDAEIVCLRGGDKLDTDLFDRSVFSFRAETDLPIGFTLGSVAFDYFSLSDVSVIGVDPFEIEGRTLYRQLDLHWQGGTWSLSGFRLNMDITLVAPRSAVEAGTTRGNAPVESLKTDVSFTAKLVNHDGPYDLDPFEGDGQLRRCEASFFTPDPVTQSFGLFPVSERNRGSSFLSRWSVGYWSDLLISDGKGYMQAGYGDLEAYDLTTDPDQPLRTDRITPGFMRDIAAYNGKAYVAMFDGVEAYATDADGKLVLSETLLAGSRVDYLSISDGLMFAVIGGETQIYDLTARGAFAPLTTLPDSYRDFRVSGNTGIGYKDGDDWFSFDMSNPATPVEHLSFATSRYIQLDGTTVYEGGSKLTIHDLSNLAAPSVVGHIDLPDNQGDMTVIGDRAYFTGDLAVIDISNPAMPALLAGNGQRALGTIAVFNDKLYLAGWNSIGVLDLTDPDHPAEVHYRQIHNPLVARQGDLVLVSMETNLLYLLDVSNPKRIVELGHFTIDGGVIYETVIQGNTAHLADIGYGYRAFDISDPANVVQTADFPLDMTPHEIFIDGGFAYLLNHSRLSILDINDVPMLSAEVLLNEGDGDDIVVSNGYAYIVGVNGLHVFDVNDPGNPIPVFTEAAWSGRRLHISGSRMFISSLEGLRIIDIQNPATPRLKALAQGSTSYGDFDIVGDFMFAAARNGSMETLDISGPGLPGYINHIIVHPWHEGPLNIAASSDNIVAVANTGNGIALELFSFYCDWPEFPVFQQKLPEWPAQMDISQLIQSVEEPCPD